ncbi:MAG TPA: hypothetical protein VNK94_08590 [Gaiellaceae bacterium]|nr:hypothetical protein [Gaiellaceae bacterium]
MQRVLLVLAALLGAAVLAGAAGAGATTYAGPQMWLSGQSAGSAFSSSWMYNYFFKLGSGHDTTVTFIDNVTYSWHATVRNTSSTTYTYWFVSNVKKGHCRAHSGYFSGSCAVIT